MDDGKLPGSLENNARGAAGCCGMKCSNHTAAIIVRLFVMKMSSVAYEKSQYSHKSRIVQ